MQLAQSHLPSGPSDRKRWGQTNSTSLAATLAQAIIQDDQRFWLVVAANTQEAYRLYEQLPFFLPSELQSSVSLFPDWEILPYDSFSPHEDIISERLSVLAQLPTRQQGALIIALPSLMHRLAPTQFLNSNSLQISVGQIIDIASLRSRFAEAGYRAVKNVFEHGEFAIRGSIMDVFPMGMKQPVRIEFFDQEIETLRCFDPESQRSTETLQAIDLLPGREFPVDARSIRTFKAQWLEAFGDKTLASPMYKDVNQGIMPGGIEYYLPLFFDETNDLFAYLPKNVVLALPQNIHELAKQFVDDTALRFNEYNIDHLRPLLPPARILIDESELAAKLDPLPRALYTSEPVAEKTGRLNFPKMPSINIQVNQQAVQPYQALLQYLQHAVADDRKILLLAESAGREAFLLEKINPALHQAKLPALKSVASWQAALASETQLMICVSRLAHPLYFPDRHLTILCEHQLYGERVAQTRRRQQQTQVNPDLIIRDLTELKPGAPVVHIDHGVGRFVGLQTITVGDDTQEFCTLVYADDTKLYVPVGSLHCISRYSGGDAETAPLHRLGNEQWAKERTRAASKAKDVASELLLIYAHRAAQVGHAHDFDQSAYDKFASEFPFEPTVDQDNAFQAVLTDMRSTQPMDRLICGDVGFGKTEVAMRAAFVATHAGRQVCLLVPTTLLAQQHFESLRDRFAQWPINIEVLSRFKTAKEQEHILQELAAGKIDILVGTHKLLQPTIKFKTLGLVIVDEEHRFGVKHKEALKRLRANLDFLTMTATPIPRTLNMSLTGMRDISIIATPPQRRLAVKTFVRESSNSMNKEAILRELMRGGQVFYLHNEVKTIGNLAEKIRTLVPEARVCIAHGQMRERELEKVMSDFYHQKYNILICTTIIETGIDIPSANTIIIDRADRFGLAQLHQLRGRVGRSHHQAYAYLLTPPIKSITKDAVKRLEAIEAADVLGAGFTLASHDLEIRGAGELLGDEQSGHIQTVGFAMFMEMLNKAVKAIEEGKTPDLNEPLDPVSEVNLHIPAIITSDYIPDPQTRLMLYKRIASAANESALNELQIEFVDRFGPLPQPLHNLFKITAIKLRAIKLGIRKIDLGDRGGKIEFQLPSKIEPMKIIKLVQNNPKEFKLRGSDILGIMKEQADGQARVIWLTELLADFEQAS